MLRAGIVLLAWFLWIACQRRYQRVFVWCFANREWTADGLVERDVYIAVMVTCLGKAPLMSFALLLGWRNEDLARDSGGELELSSIFWIPAVETLLTRSREDSPNRAG